MQQTQQKHSYKSAETYFDNPNSITIQYRIYDLYLTRFLYIIEPLLMISIRVKNYNFGFNQTLNIVWINCSDKLVLENLLSGFTRTGKVSQKYFINTV